MVDDVDCCTNGGDGLPKGLITVHVHVVGGIVSIGSDDDRDSDGPSGGFGPSLMLRRWMSTWWGGLVGGRRSPSVTLTLLM